MTEDEMSCFERPEWAQVFDCAYDYLAEPVYFWMPGRIWLLLIGALCMLTGAVTGALLYLAAEKVFGKDRVMDALDFPAVIRVEIRWYWHEWRHHFRAWRQRRRQAAGKEHGAKEAPADDWREAE